MADKTTNSGIARARDLDKRAGALLPSEPFNSQAGAPEAVEPDHYQSNVPLAEMEPAKTPEAPSVFRRVIAAGHK